MCLPPNEATPTKLFWYRNGPWKRTVVRHDVVTHSFPALHSDFLTQYIDYPAPVDKADDITCFDGSCLVDRTAGEVAAHCDSEAVNIITLNLMHEAETKYTQERCHPWVYFVDQTSALATGGGSTVLCASCARWHLFPVGIQPGSDLP
jgi:hypothetical protein